ncbi:MAG: hypothetical protein HYU36_00040 [Planctomycetes bacterium]|nr:hypothetical protein [Planctomycetota bacterium]
MIFQDSLPDAPGDFLLDRQGNSYLCLTGESGGVARCGPHRLHWIERGDVGGAAPASDGRIYVTTGNRVCTIHPDDQASKEDVTSAFGGSPNGRRRVWRTRTGEVWVEGCSWARLPQGHFARAPGWDGPATPPVPMAEDPCGNAWSLADDREMPGFTRVCVLHPGQGRNWRPLPTAWALRPGAWQHIAVDDAGFVWAGGPPGLARLDPRKPDGGWLEFPAAGEGNGRVTALGISRRGRLLVGDASGFLSEVDALADGGAARTPAASPERFRGPVRAAAMDREGRLCVLAGGLVCREDPPEGVGQAFWLPLGKLPCGNHDITGVELGGRFYVAGGLTAYHGFPARTHVFDDIWAYDPDADAWSVAGRLGLPRCYSGVAALAGRIWIIGGYANIDDPGNPDAKRVPVDTVEIFDPVSSECRSGPPLRPERSTPVALSDGGRLYVFGGLDRGGANLNRVESIGPGETAWRREADMPVPMGQHAGCVLDGFFYLCAGKHGVYAFDPASGRWDASLPPIPEIPRSPLMASHGGEVWVMGGQDVKNATASHVYSPRARAWRAGPEIPTRQAWGAAGEIRGRLILAGGAHWSEPAKCFVYEDRVFQARDGR